MDIKRIIKQRIMILIINIVVVTILIINYLNANLMPVVLKYGEYQCVNVVTKMVNFVVEEFSDEKVIDEIVEYRSGEILTIDFNSNILNSLSAMFIKKIQFYLYQFENGDLDDDLKKEVFLNYNITNLKKGIVYEIPLGMALGKPFLSNIGFKIPVRYSVLGETKGNIISELKEYGINNALLEIKLHIEIQSVVSIPSLSEERKIVVEIPLLMKLIQGNIPDSFFGKNIWEGMK